MTATKDADRSPAHSLVVHPQPLLDGPRASWLRRLVRRVPWGIVGPLLSLGLFAGALIVLATILREVDADQVVAAFTAMPASLVGISILCTALSYLALTGYDGLALRQIGAANVPYSTAAIGSFTSYAISYTLGLPLLTAGTVRYRVYGGAGLSAPQIAALTLVCTVTFWLGMGAVLGFGLILVPEAVSGINHLPLIVNMAIGLAILLAITAYVAYVATKRRIVTIEGWSLPLPGGRVTVLQLLLGVVDVCAGAAALYVLLPGQVPEPFFTFMVIYVLAAILGVASHAPGGIGVFEATMLIALPSMPRDQLLGSILLFRVIYYFAPFALALATLGFYELARRRHMVGRLVDQASGVMKPLAPIMVSGVAFLAGAAMIVTGAAPVGMARRETLMALVPLPLVELAHVTGSLAGIGLLFLARGLVRRVENAWYAASLMLAVAIVTAIMRSADLRLALAMFGGLAVILLSRTAFSRNVRVFGQDFSWPLLGAVASVLAVAIWIGFFAFRYVDYHASLWLTFGYDDEMPRFLRSTAIAALAALGIVLFSLTRSRRQADSGDALLGAAILEMSQEAQTRLALLPEVSILATQGRDAALMLARSGSSCVAFGDPVGAPGKAQELLFAFAEQAEKDRLWPVIVGASPGKLPLYLEAGLTVTPIGENAAIDLTTLAPEPFEGAAAIAAFADLEGLSVDLVPAAAVEPLLPALTAVSDAWLAEHGGREGHFTLGRCSRDWLTANDCAVLRQAGEVVGFAVVLRAGDAEWAVDILRYRPALGPMALDFLLLRVLRLAAARGVKRFDLGLTPTPDLTADNLRPTWQRVTPLLFRFGDHFADFHALRAFKLRFSPIFERRYLACTAGFALPHILLDVTGLIENGPQPATPPAA